MVSHNRCVGGRNQPGDNKNVLPGDISGDHRLPFGIDVGADPGERWPHLGIDARHCARWDWYSPHRALALLAGNIEALGHLVPRKSHAVLESLASTG